jgi:acyl transferase domain-containing protein/thioesterase domain-containing protein/acyl carrier protein
MSQILENNVQTGLEVAIIGMAGRFPGANNINTFWQNLITGQESISYFTDDQLITADVNPETLSHDNYVRANGAISDHDLFDADFFGYSPKDAATMDPQMRLFHQCVWEAIEDAGYDPQSNNGEIGLYAGGAQNLMWEVMTAIKGSGSSAEQFSSMGLAGMEKLSTRVSYNLNLSGPSIYIDSACSTSLVAVHFACQGLINGDCDMALAGGVSVRLTQTAGYLYQEGMIFSPDGHCRAFDEGANGVVGGNGVAVVMLKLLEEAIIDRDHIYAIIKGSAVKNDGSQKAGYSAPGIEGQIKTIKAALHIAEVEPQTISYIEAHGTGTPMGDPVEFDALKSAFDTEEKGFCGIGSVKTNIGHLDTAAGVAGLIKTALALKHKQIPPNLHYQSPNPRFDIQNSPFYIVSKPMLWQQQNNDPLRAGVSSFGIGGTNAHAVMQEFLGPNQLDSNETSEADELQLILLSAKNKNALTQITHNLQLYLQHHPKVNIADLAYTLKKGRSRFNHRQMLACTTAQDAQDALINSHDNRSPHYNRLRTHLGTEEKIRPIFMFPGQGAQYVQMGRELYLNQDYFKEQMDHCFQLLQPLTPLNLKEILYPNPQVPAEELSDAIPLINQTQAAQPLIFIIQYALARLLIHWGISPHAMIGHSIGEYATAVIANVLSLEDALKLVVQRGRLMQQCPTGAMLSVPLDPEQLKPLLNQYEALSLAAVNTPNLCVVSGPHPMIESFAQFLKEKGIHGVPLHTSHAFHSGMMNSILDAFRSEVATVTLNKPQIPYISNLTGNWITSGNATDPDYWVRHIREAVRFSDSINTLQEEENLVYLEIGPGRVLSRLAAQCLPQANEQSLQFLNFIRHPKEDIADNRFLLTQLGNLWLQGANIDWNAFYTNQKRYRLSLPTYPFQPTRFEIDTSALQKLIKGDTQTTTTRKKSDISQWFYKPHWEKKPLSPDGGEKRDPVNWIIFSHDHSFDAALKEAITNATPQDSFFMVKQGRQFHIDTSKNEYTIDAGQKKHYQQLLSHLTALNRHPHRIIHLWAIDKKTKNSHDIDYIQQQIFYSLLYLVQAIQDQGIKKQVQMTIISQNMQFLPGDNPQHHVPEKATLLGLSKMIPLEYPNISSRSIDISGAGIRAKFLNALTQLLIHEWQDSAHDPVVAYRNDERYIQTYPAAPIPNHPQKPKLIKPEGVYLITGGLGGIGLQLARFLAQEVQAKLVLISRTAPPPDDPRLEIIRQLEELGATVKVETGDITDLNRMTEIIDDVKKSFQTINGVVHAAGVPDGGLIQLRTREIIEFAFAAKVKGTLVLEQCLKEMPLDFIVFCSSVSSILPPFGQVAYSAANAFLDAHAAIGKNSRGTTLISINWAGWQEVGMAVAAVKKAGEDPQVALKDAILPQEGVEAFKRILANPVPQIAVSPDRDIQQLFSQFRVDTRLPEPPSQHETPQTQRYPRPEMDTPYIPPQSQIQETIAEIWQDTLGLQQVGIDDDYYRLGGDSLKSLTIVSKVQETLDLEVTVGDILVYPNIKQLTDFLQETRVLDKLDCVVRMNAGGNEKNIFILHPFHGQVYQYKELATLLQNHFNVYGIQSRGLVKDDLLPQTPQMMIADYVHQIRKIQPQGPYIIGGYCFGNVVGYQVVNELELSGSVVEKFIMFDESAFISERIIAIMKKIRRRKPIYKFYNKIVSFLTRRPYYDPQQAIQKYVDQVNSTPNPLDPDIPTLPSLEPIDPQKRQEIVEQNNRTFNSIFFVTGIINAPITAIKTQDNEDPLFAIEHMSTMTSKAVAVKDTPGDHDSMFSEPHVQTLAKIILDM